MDSVESVEGKIQPEEIPVQYWYNGCTAIGGLSNRSEKGYFQTAQITSAPSLEDRVYIMEAIMGIALVRAEELMGKRIFWLRPGMVWGE